MDRRRVRGAARRYARVAAVVTAAAMVVAGVTLAALPRGGGSHPGPGVLPPGSMGSLPSPHAWWDPRGWFGGHAEPPKPRRIHSAGGPSRTPVPRRAAAPRPRRVRELTGRRTATTRVYRLSDGRLQADISAAPVSYRDAAGRWQPVDTGVRPSARPGYRYASTANTFRSFFGTAPGRLVRLQAPGGGWLQMGLDGAHPARPQVAGNTVTYPQVAPGAGLSYRVTPAGLTEGITLASAPAAPPSFSFTVTVGGGLVPYRRAGQVVFSRTGVGGPPVLVMPRPFLTDSRRDPWSPFGVSWSPKVAQRLRWDPAAHVLRVTLTPDAGWLRQAGRRFPVVIDPTINVAPPPGQAQSTVISSDTPNTGYGPAWPLPVGTTPTGAVRSLLQFTMPTWIPAGTQIDSADLRLYRDQEFGSSPASQTIEVHQATGPWDATATWASANGLVGAEGLNQVTVDNTDGSGSPNPDTARTGNWQTAAAATNGEYVYNQDSAPGDTFTWVPRLTEPGTYSVAAHYAATPSAATSAPFTVHYSGGSQAYSVNQQSGTGGVWASLGAHPFVAGTTGTVVLGDGPASASTRVIADTVAFKLWGEAVASPSPANVWDSFPVRSIVQSWLDTPTSNYGLVVKTANESVLGKGGPRYEGAVVNAFGGETATNPQLVITYGRPSAVLNQITTIRGNGADLSWTPYTDPTPGTFPGDDLGEYQVHRSTKQTFNPTNANLVAPVTAGTTTYSDTSATPTPPGGPPSVVYYMVMVKTAGGGRVPGPAQKVILPQAGFTTQVINASGTTTLSQAQPATAEQHLAGQPWLAAGDNSATYGVTRTAVQFPALASQGIPATAVVTGAQLKLWGWSNTNTGGGPATYEAHALTQDFDPAAATWASASAGTPWGSAGGAFSAGVDGPVSGLTSDPAADQWPVATVVKGWVATPASQHGFLVKLAAETPGSPQEQELFLDTTAAEPALRPQLVVTYLNATTEDTYYVPTLPDDMASGSAYPVPVTVTNTTGVTLTAADWAVSYHWSLPDGTPVNDPAIQLDTHLPADLPAGGSVTVTAQLDPPTVNDPGGTGNIRAAYVLGWDLHNTTTNTWLSGTNPGLPQIGPLTQPTSVVKPGPALLGLEKYYQYTGMGTGSGSALLNNDATGNVVWSYNAFSNPSAGFATFVRLAYNSMDTSNSSMGFGWSLQASTLMRLGTPLDFHPNPQDQSATATLTDGDGTTHTFTRANAASPWVSPQGFHYFLQQNAPCDPSGKTQDDQAWVMTRPDRTQIWFDCQGYQSKVIDRNGNEADFAYETKTSNNQPVKFLRSITDPIGQQPAPRQTLTISYYQKGDQDYSYIDATGTVVHVVPSNNNPLTNPKIIDQVKSITDISGRTITFLYTTQGLMGQMADGDGTQLAKVFTFGYDMTQGNKNVKLVSVTDPRTDPGVHTTHLAYYTAPVDPAFKWSLRTLTDRRGNTAGFAYTQPPPAAPPPPPGGAIQAVVTDQRGNASTYVMDSSGKPLQVTDAKGQKTQLGWDGDNNVTSLTEDNGAHTTWTYDPLTGYPLTMTDAQANHDTPASPPHTTYGYNRSPDHHIADLASILTPQQRLWTFGYDPNGNLTTVTDPDGNVPSPAFPYTTHYTYDPLGELHTAQDANGNTTTYTNYDPNGYPQTITDPGGHAWAYTYDVRGNVTSSADPLADPDVTSYGPYDVFGRPGKTVVPKDHRASPPVYITIPAPVYDGNDNVIRSFDGTGAETGYTYNPNDQLASKTLPPTTAPAPCAPTPTSTTRPATRARSPSRTSTTPTPPPGPTPPATATTRSTS